MSNLPSPIPNVTEKTTLRKHYDDRGNLIFYSVWQDGRIVYVSKEQAKNFTKTFLREGV